VGGGDAGCGGPAGGGARLFGLVCQGGGSVLGQPRSGGMCGLRGFKWRAEAEGGALVILEGVVGVKSMGGGRGPWGRGLFVGARGGELGGPGGSRAGMLREGRG